MPKNIYNDSCWIFFFEREREGEGGCSVKANLCGWLPTQAMAIQQGIYIPHTWKLAYVGDCQHKPWQYNRVFTFLIQHTIDPGVAHNTLNDPSHLQRTRIYHCESHAVHVVQWIVCVQQLKEGSTSGNWKSVKLRHCSQQAFWLFSRDTKY